MLLHPEAQKRAQEEIDRVIGSTRLPNYADRPNMPFVDGVMREVLRWHAPVAIGTKSPRPGYDSVAEASHVCGCSVPRNPTKDDVYEGRLIPEGSFVLMNFW